MLCQMCRRAEATIHLSGPVLGGPPVESHYCRACFPIRPTGHTAGAPAFPLSRFTIKGLMIVGGLFGLLDAAVVLLLRDAAVPGAPAGTDEAALRTVLFANVAFAVLAAEVLAALWLSRVRWYRMTGRWVPLMHSTQLRIERLLAGRAGMPIGRWLGASRGERLFSFSRIPWIVLCLSWLTPGRMRAWLPMSGPELAVTWLLLVAGGMIFLDLGVVASTRRRKPVPDRSE